MKLVTYICIFSYISSSFGMDCRVSYTTESPVNVSKVSSSTEESFNINGKIKNVSSFFSKESQSTLLTEPVYSNQFIRNGRTLKKGTIVKIEGDYAANDLLGFSNFVKVQVLSNKNKDLNHILPNPNSPLDKFETGFVNFDSLVPLSNFSALYFGSSLVLNEDAYILSFRSNKFEVFFDGLVLKPVEQMGSYKIEECRRLSGEVLKYYLYTAKNIDGEYVDTLKLTSDQIACNDFRHIEDVHLDKAINLFNHLRNTFSSNFKFSDLEINEWGLVRLPSSKTTDMNRIYYQEFLGSDPINSDKWGDPDTICEFLTIQDEWNQYCTQRLKLSTKRCTIQVGDISFITPGKTKSGKDPLGHLHHDGTCIDIRPFRKDQKMIGTTITVDKKGYDSKLTKEFLSFIEMRGASPIYFSDKSINKHSFFNKRKCTLKDPSKDLDRGVLDCKGHQNHIHFCLKKPRVRGCGI